MQNSWQTDLPVSRNGHVHRQSLMELTWLGPSTVRNPSAENLQVQRSRDPHQKKTAPECISSIAFLNATICPPMSLSQGTKYSGNCIHPSSYQCLHCLKPDCLHHIPCCFALPPCLAGHPHLWNSPACFRHNSFSGHKDIP